jgi:hypothetical protein
LSTRSPLEVTSVTAHVPLSEGSVRIEKLPNGASSGPKGCGVVPSGERK